LLESRVSFKDGALLDLEITSKSGKELPVIPFILSVLNYGSITIPDGRSVLYASEFAKASWLAIAFVRSFLSAFTF